MDMASVIGIAQVAEGLPALLSGLKRRKGEKPASIALALPAYLAFQESTVTLLQHYNTARTLGVPPRLAGAVWTWPSVWRAHKGIQSSWIGIVTAVTDVRVFGSDEVFNAAHDVLEGIGKASRAFPHSSRNRARWNREGDVFDGEAQSTYEALWAFGNAVRKEVLGSAPPRITDAGSAPELGS